MNKHFIHLLLNCGKNQGIALLETADPSQTQDILKILFNFPLNKSNLPVETQKLISKHSKLINKITKKLKTERQQYNIIRKQAKIILSLLQSAKKTLVKAIQ